MLRLRHLSLGLLLLSLSTQATQVIYPGTFDPFHKSHYEDVDLALEALKEKKEVSITIMPVGDAYYNKAEGTDVFRPTLFDFSERSQFIQAVYENKAKVSVLSDFSSIKKNIFETLSKKLKEISDNSQDEDVRILIGSDVVSTWAELPGFEKFATNHSLMVVFDPHNSTSNKLARQLKKRFKLLSLIEGGSSGIRSSALSQILLTQDLEELKKYIPLKLYKYMKENREQWADSIIRYQDDLNHYFSALLKPKVSTKIKNLPITQCLKSYFTKNDLFLGALVTFNLESSEEFTKRLTAFSLCDVDAKDSESIRKSLLATLNRHEKIMREYAFEAKVNQIVSSADLGIKIKNTKAGKEIWAIHQGEFKKIGSLFEYEKGGSFYHWGDRSMVSKWQQDGFVSEEQLQYKIDYQQGRMGGGFYASTDPLDTKNYGSSLAVLEIEEPFMLAELDVSPDAEAVRILKSAGIYGVRGRGSHFTNRSGSHWISFIQPEAVLNVRESLFSDLTRSKMKIRLNLASTPFGLLLEYFEDPKKGKKIFLESDQLSFKEQKAALIKAFQEFQKHQEFMPETVSSDNPLVLQLKKWKQPILKFLDARGVLSAPGMGNCDRALNAH